MAPSSNTGAVLSPPEVAVSGGRFSDALRVVRGLVLGPKYESIIADIQTAFDVSERTAERIYAGQAVSGDTTFAVLLHEKFGGPVLEDALRRIPIERRAQVATALRESADLIRMEAEHETLARELANKRAGR